VVFCVPRKRQDELVPIIVDEMLHPSFDWVSVPLSIEVSVGPNWADMERLGTYFSDELT
jgi:DNA polymerase I-like protein with 3'-5' exonuclease and polymerase domains